MTFDEGAQLLNMLGVEAQVAQGATIDDLDRWVDVEGRSVILAVDSDEVWQQADDDFMPDDKGMDHALRLAEIDKDNGIAILEDPGNPEGRGYEIGLSDLENALDDQNGTCIVTSATGAGLEGESAIAEPVPTSEPTPTPEPQINLDTPEPEPGSPEWVDKLPVAAAVVAAAGAGAVVLARVFIANGRDKIKPRPALG